MGVHLPCQLGQVVGPEFPVVLRIVRAVRPEFRERENLSAPPGDFGLVLYRPEIVCGFEAVDVAAYDVHFAEVRAVFFVYRNLRRERVEPDGAAAVFSQRGVNLVPQLSLRRGRERRAPPEPAAVHFVHRPEYRHDPALVEVFDAVCDFREHSEPPRFLGRAFRGEKLFSAVAEPRRSPRPSSI